MLILLERVMAGKKALCLYTSGGSYSTETFNLSYPNWDSISLSFKVNFNFMGFDTAEVIGVSSRWESDDAKVAALATAREKLTALASQWYV